MSATRTEASRPADPANDTEVYVTSPRRPLLLATLLVAIPLSALLLTRTADARPAEAAKVEPIRAPAELLRARAACPNDSSIPSCRAALRRAYAAVRWQRSARWHAKATTAQEITRDAIHWAAEKYGHGAAGEAALERQMIGIGLCESHLWLWATNGQYLSWAQLSERHRSDPVIARLTWRDPYAVADHVARYILRYGESEWQCRSTGGLRW